MAFFQNNFVRRYNRTTFPFFRKKKSHPETTFVYYTLRTGFSRVSGIKPSVAFNTMAKKLNTRVSWRFFFPSRANRI